MRYLLHMITRTNVIGSEDLNLEPAVVTSNTSNYVGVFCFDLSVLHMSSYYDYGSVANESCLSTCVI